MAKHYRVAVVFRHQGLEAVNVNLLAARCGASPGASIVPARPTIWLDSGPCRTDGRWPKGYSAPTGCTALDVELYLRFAPQGTV